MPDVHTTMPQEQFSDGAVRTAAAIHECDGNGAFSLRRRAKYCQGMIGRNWEYLEIASSAGVVYSRHCLPCAREYFADGSAPR